MSDESGAVAGGLTDRLTHPLTPAAGIAAVALALGAAAATGHGTGWPAGLLWLVFAANAGYAVSGSV